MNNGSCALPLVSDDVVVVTEAELTVVAAVPLLSTCSVEPDGLENCRPAAAERGVQLRNHRRHAAGEIDPDQLRIGVGRRSAAAAQTDRSRCTI